MFEVIVGKEGMEFLGWREVPTDPTKLGQKAVDCMPYIMQGFVKRPADVEKGLAFDRKLYVARRVFEQSNDDTYVVSLSSRTIVYKGMFLVEQLRLFFADLQDKDYESAIATVHSRFSTNTNPSWERAHPNRFIVHNGEINTIKGNADKMLAREETMESEHLKGELQKVLPVINSEGSDSAMLDNTLEFLVMSGMELPLAVMIMIPEPWANNNIMSQKKKDFYQYYATMMEPWDGPASILFSDGDMMGAVLDRNGLRPSRYYITDDDYLILSSEVGVLDIDPTKIVVKERLRPGKMLLVDTVKGRVIDDDELKETYANKQPYGEWLDRNLLKLEDLKIPNERVPEYTKEERQRMQKAFGYTYESLREAILPMAKNGGEGTSAMGIDTPLAALASDHQPLFNYFKQLFAQVTNPPIDSIREKVVTSTTVYIGEDGKKHRPYMVHRALMGSLERFFGILIEQYAGAFPMWLAPEQARLLPVSEKQLDYAKQVELELRRKGFRVETDVRASSLGAKIKDARNARIPYLLVVGEREAEEGAVAARSRREGELGTLSIEQLAEKMRFEVENKIV